ncbi:MAG: protein kinase domain-containing protein [Anaerolineae bacterium]
MQDLAGKILDKTYRIEKMLGQGGMGAVFLGHDLTLDRDVAIKIMHPHIANQEGFRERFLQEARAVANLDYPGIVHVLSFSRDAELLYIVMSFIAGQNLRDWLVVFKQRGQMLQLGEALTVCAVLADALDYAHSHGVYHRDIKPSNIILRPLEPGRVTEGGLVFQPVITDFGLAKLAEGGVQSVTGLSVGTPAYMSPEQCQGQPVDGRTDIYALGIVFYEITTGRIPFDVKSLVEAIRAHSHDAPPPPRTLRPTMPSQVEEIILKALAKTPAARFTKASDMAAALRSARAALPTAAPAAAAVEPEPKQALSLATVVGQELVASPPQNDAWPTPQGEIPKSGMIVVMTPNGSMHQVPFGDRTMMTIGRDKGCELVLDDSRVSRRHAQVNYDGLHCSLTDLSSTNGSFLGTTKLLPGISETWKPNVVARIGDHWLRLYLQQAQAQAGAFSTYQGQGAPQVRVEPVQMVLEPPNLEIKPGEVGAFKVRILNGQRQVDHFVLAVEGLPAEWVTKPTTALRLAPGDSGELVAQIRPPKDLTGQPRMNYTVRVSSQVNPAITVYASGVLDLPGVKAPVAVSPVVESPAVVSQAFSADLAPSRFVNEGRGRIRVSSKSAANQTVALSARSTDTRIETSLVAQQVSLAPGEVKAVAVGVISHHRRPLLGRNKTYPFSVLVAGSSNESVTLPGQVTVTPRLPWWVLLLVFLVLTACGVLATTDVVPVRKWVEDLFGSRPGGGTGITFMPNRDIVIDPGACLWFEWDAPSASEVYFQGNPVPSKERSYQCPENTTTYYLTVIGADGNKTSRQVTVSVGTSSAPQEPAKAIQRYLVRWTEKGLEPDLAIKWDVSPDGKTWTFWLDKVRLENGDILTSSAVTELLKQNAAEMARFPDIQIIDDFTLTVTFNDAPEEDIIKIITRVVFYTLQ